MQVSVSKFFSKDALLENLVEIVISFGIFEIPLFKKLCFAELLAIYVKPFY